MHVFLFIDFAHNDKNYMSEHLQTGLDRESSSLMGNEQSLYLQRVGDSTERFACKGSVCLELHTFTAEISGYFQGVIYQFSAVPSLHFLRFCFGDYIS